MNIPPVREIRDFSWAWLPSWRRAEVSQIRSIVRHIGPSPRTDLLGPRWVSLLGSPLDTTPYAPFVITRAAALQTHEGLSLAAVLQHPSVGVALALCDRRGALRLAARALGTDDESSRRVASENTFTQAYEGALMALLARALSLAVAPEPPPSLRAVTEHIRDALDALDADPLIAWPLRVSLGDDALHLTLLATARSLTALPLPAPVSLRRVGSLEVSFAVLAARDVMPARVLGTLRPGDALVMDSVVWRQGRLSGAVTLDFVHLELPALIEAQSAVRITSAITARREVMTEPEESPDATAVRTEALASLPVEVAVEIARTTVSVGEIARWRVGEVISFDTPLGERVTVRAGGRPMARGELVELEGEVGVRITEIL